MIGYVRGKITHKTPDCCFVDVQGVGYRVFVSTNTNRKLALGQEATLYTYLSVREDAMLLYGFCEQMEYDLFLRLISVAGVGPKVALGVMSAISAADFCKAIRQKHVPSLTKLPGIGKKTAERMILELYDKMSAVDDLGDALPEMDEAVQSDLSEAAQALLSLGYTQAEIAPILRKVNPAASVEEAVKFALKEFARRT